jgi:hypothetical protein
MSLLTQVRVDLAVGFGIRDPLDHSAAVERRDPAGGGLLLHPLVLGLVSGLGVRTLVGRGDERRLVAGHVRHRRQAVARPPSAWTFTSTGCSTGALIAELRAQARRAVAYEEIAEST